MSQHYELTLSLRFRRDVPESFLEELRSDFGIGAGPASDGDGSALPGGPVTSLVRQRLSADTWLSATQGWIGFAREELSLHPGMPDEAEPGEAA